MTSELEAASRTVGDFVDGNLGYLAGRTGATEFSLLVNPLTTRQVVRAKINAGLWPPVPSQIIAFKQRYLSALASANLLATWGESTLKGESALLDRVAPSAVRVPLTSLDPVTLLSRGAQPWSTHLAGLRVCVISPLAEQIESQYARRRELFASDVDVLPAFHLSTVATPKTHGLSVSAFTWTRNLQRLVNSALDAAGVCDVALVSAGAYGMPLANELSRKGVRSIYMGGCLQLLFGIWGARWKTDERLRAIATDRWIEAPRSSAPLGFRLIEGGAYW